MCELIFLTSALKKIDHTSKGFIYVCLGYGFCKGGGGGLCHTTFSDFFLPPFLFLKLRYAGKLLRILVERECT